MAEASPPLTPADCDLRAFAFMPLDVQRLRDSDLAAMETPEACWAAVLLWGASWHQVPAASLPDDDRVLANLAGYGRVVREWLKVRDGALRGFVLCSDGRFYHPVVAEKAREAWRGRQERMWRTECARIRKHNQRHGTDDPVPDMDEWIAAGCVPVPLSSPETDAHCPTGQAPTVPEDNWGVSNDCHTETGSKGKGDSGEGTVDSGKKEQEPRKRGVGGAVSAQEDDAFGAFWAIYPLKKGKAPAKQAFIAVLRSGKATIEQIMHGAQAYAGERAGKDPSKTKYAQGWLNDQRWDDEPLPAQGTGSRKFEIF